jgi:uncharacterized membrane protein
MSGKIEWSWPRVSGITVPHLGLLLLASMSLALVLPLPTPLAFVYGAPFLVLPGVFLLALLDVDVPPTEWFVYAVGLGLGLNMGAVMIGTIPLSAIGVHTLAEPVVYAFPVTSTLLPYAVFRYRYSEIFSQARASLFPVELSTRTTVEYLTILLLPLAAAGGAFVANNTGSFLGTIAFYVSALLLVVYLFVQNDITERQYTTAVYTLTLGMFFALTVRTGFVVGADAHNEVYSVTKALDKQRWLFADPKTVTSMVTSITLLGPLLVYLFDLNAVGVLKFAYPFVLALVPVCGYLLFSRVVSSRCGFLLSVLAVSHVTFWAGFHANNRMGIAILFTMLFFLIVLSEDTHRLLALVFIVVGITSHYTIAFTFLLFFFGFIFINVVHTRLFTDRRGRQFGTIAVFALLGTFLYYTYINSRFTRMIEVGILDALLTLQDFFPSLGSDVSSSASSDSGLTTDSLPDLLVTYSLFFEFGLLFVGGVVIVILLARSRYNPFWRLRPLPFDQRDNDWRTGLSGADDAVWLASLVAIGLFGLFYLARTSLAPSRVQAQFQFVYLVLFLPGAFVLTRLTVVVVNPLFAWMPTLGTVDHQRVFIGFLVLTVAVFFPLQVGLVHTLQDESIQVNLGTATGEAHYVSTGDIQMVQWYGDHYSTTSGVVADDTGRRLLYSAGDIPIDEALAAPSRTGWSHQYWLVRQFNDANPGEKVQVPASDSNKVYTTGTERIHSTSRDG